MRGFTVEYYRTLTDAIARVEETTAAEIVVVVEPRSGSYRDVDLAVGVGVALLGLIGIVFGPWPHSEVMTVVDVALLFAVGAWVSSAQPGIRRALTRPLRRALQVRDASSATYHLERIGTTRGRTGVLVYLSLLEAEVVVLADSGVTTAVPAGSWNDCLIRLHSVPKAADPPAALIAAVEEAGCVLAEALPPDAENPDELPNLPRSHRS